MWERAVALLFWGLLFNSLCINWYIFFKYVALFPAPHKGRQENLPIEKQTKTTLPPPASPFAGSNKIHIKRGKETRSKERSCYRALESRCSLGPRHRSVSQRTYLHVTLGHSQIKFCSLKGWAPEHPVLRRQRCVWICDRHRGGPGVTQQHLRHRPPFGVC